METSIMNAVVERDEELSRLPAPVARRGIDEAAWRTAMNNLFPGAKVESVLMVFDYCRARKLDPLKKPCHIVPMEVGGVWRDVVMPGIYEYRTTAMRTGQYMGHSKPEYGEIVECKGVMAPEWCSLTIYRWNAAANQRTEFPVTVYFSECVGTRWDKEAKTQKANARWAKAPRQMLTKCAEAAGLREAFPDELGGEHTAEEMEGQSFQQTEETGITLSRIDPRGDTSGVDWEVRDKCVSEITDILNADKEEHEIAEMLREYESTRLQPFQELYITVQDKLAADGIISKANFKKYLKVGLEPQDRH
jgi:phage recombination protein Bet